MFHDLWKPESSTLVPADLCNNAPLHHLLLQLSPAKRYKQENPLHIQSSQFNTSERLGYCRPLPWQSQPPFAASHPFHFHWLIFEQAIFFHFFWSSKLQFRNYLQWPIITLSTQLIKPSKLVFPKWVKGVGF